MEDMYVGGRGPLDNMRSLEQYLPDPGGHRGQGAYSFYIFTENVQTDQKFVMVSSRVMFEIKLYFRCKYFWQKCSPFSPR